MNKLYTIHVSKDGIGLEYTKNGKQRFAMQAVAISKNKDSIELIQLYLPILIQEMEKDMVK